MSEDVETRLRSLRRRIIQELLSLPWRFANAVQPDTLTLGELYGRRLLNAPTRAVRAGIYDPDTGAEIKPSRIQLWEGVNVSETFIPAVIARSIDQLNRIGIPYVLYYYDQKVGERVAKRERMGSVKYRVASLNILSMHAPPGYPPSDPMTVTASGVVYRDTHEYIDLTIVRGSVGYTTAGGDTVYWTGVLVAALADAGARAETPWGSLGTVGDETVQLVVVTSAWSLVARAADWG